MKKFLLITLSLVLVISMCSCALVEGVMDMLGLGEKEPANTLFSDGMLCVKYDGKYGYIDMEGEFIIEPQYDFATPFIGDVAFVTDGDYNCIIDREGNIIETYEEGDEYSTTYYEVAYSLLYDETIDFVDDLHIYKTSKDKYGYKNSEGDVVIRAQFDAALPRGR